MFNRRCGVVSFVVLAILAFLVCGPFALSQALTMVHTGTRSAGSSVSGYNGDFGSATTVDLANPSYIVFDSNGNQFISDTLNNCVRKIDTSGNITTIVGLAVSGQGDTCNTAVNAAPTPAQGLYRPTGLAIDSTNRLYIADSMHNCVRTLVSGQSGVANLTTVAGTCGSAPAASVTPAPNGLALDTAGNLYISLEDSVSVPHVFQVVQHLAAAPTTNVCLVAGASSASVSTTCPGITNGITLSNPSGLAINITGDLFIADTGNSCVRQIAGLASGTATPATAVGQCLNDGSGSSATALSSPYGLAFSPMQSLFIAESNNIASFAPGTTSLTLIGGLPSGTAGSYQSTQDGESALSSPLNNPRGIAFDSMAHLFVADSLNNIVRELSTNLRFPSTPVGSPSSIQPVTFAINQAVNLSASAGTDYSITSTTCSGSLSPAAPGASPNTCQVFLRFTPTRPGMRRSPLKLTDSISASSISLGLQSIGTGALNLYTPGASATVAASLASPLGITTDAAGNAYVLETSGTPDIRLIPAASGPSSRLLGPGPGFTTPTAIASDAAGNWFIADSTLGTIARFGADGSVNASYLTGLDTPVALSIDVFNNLYVAQAGSTNNVIEVYNSGVRRIVAGSGANTSAHGVPATTASFVSPSAITMDLNGTLYIADRGAHLVYAVDTTGIIHIIAGNGSTTTTLPGQALGTALIAPSSLAVDAAGDLYIADQSSGIVSALYSNSSNGNNIATVINTSAPPAPNGPLSIALDGSSNLFVSIAASNSVLEVTYPNPTLSFGAINLGNTSAVVLQNILNAGNDNLNITNPFSTTDAHFAVNSSATTCGTSILTGSVCSIGFTFTPTAPAPYSATSVISSNSFDSPQPITLVGTGKQTIALTTALAAQTEVYGQPFPETVTFGSTTTAPTGTITFTTGGQTLCTFTGTLSTVATCSAAASGLTVGSYPVTFNYSGDNTYNPASGIVTLTVTPAPLTEVVNNTTRSYGAANPAFSGTLTGVDPGDTILVSFSTTATSASPVGSYPIVATLTTAGSASLSNYTITNTPGSLSVTTAPLVITANNASRSYGAANPSFTGTVTGLQNGDALTIIYLTTASTSSPVGNYPIVPTVSGAARSNYAISVVNGTLSITANGNSLVINVNSASRVYGAANPTFSGSVAGVMPGDNVVVTYSTSATSVSSSGTYPIGASVSGTSAGNYIATIHPGTLAINPASTVTTVSTSAASAYAGTSVTFTASVAASSGQPAGVVTFFDGTVMLGNAQLNNGGVAAFTTNTLAIGSHNISAAFQANTNFTTSAASLTQVVARVTGSFSVGANPPAPYIKGAGATTYQVSVTANGSFAGPVALTCSGLPSDAACSFANSTVNLTAGSTVTTTMTVTTTVADAKLIAPAGLPGNPANIAPLTAAVLFPSELTGLGVLFAGLRRRKLLGTQKMRLLLLIVCTLGILGLVGCGCPSTTFQTYNINITGTSLSFPAPAQTTTVVLSVGQ